MITRVERERLRGVPDEEPLFILRAQDVLAPTVVRQWADAAEAAGVRSGKVAEARLLADDMDRWPTKKVPD